MKINKKIFYTIIICLLLVGILVLTAPISMAGSNFSQGLTDTAGRTGLKNRPPADIAAQVVKTLLTLVGIIFMILIIYSGFTWMTSQGVEEKVKKAQKSFTRASIGLAIIFFAYVITSFVAFTLERPGDTGLIPDYNEACEDSQDLNYYSINCCIYRYQVRQEVSAQCCEQSAFCNFSNSIKGACVPDYLPSCP